MCWPGGDGGGRTPEEAGTMRPTESGNTRLRMPASARAPLAAAASRGHHASGKPYRAPHLDQCPFRRRAPGSTGRKRSPPGISGSRTHGVYPALSPVITAGLTKHATRCAPVHSPGADVHHRKCSPGSMRWRLQWTRFRNTRKALQLIRHTEAISRRGRLGPDERGR